MEKLQILFPVELWNIHSAFQESLISRECPSSLRNFPLCGILAVHTGLTNWISRGSRWKRTVMRLETKIWQVAQCAHTSIFKVVKSRSYWWKINKMTPYFLFAILPSAFKVVPTMAQSWVLTKSRFLCILRLWLVSCCVIESLTLKMAWTNLDFPWGFSMPPYGGRDSASELNATTFRQSSAKYLFDGGSCLTILTWLGD